MCSNQVQIKIRLWLIKGSNCVSSKFDKVSAQTIFMFTDSFNCKDVLKHFKDWLSDPKPLSCGVSGSTQ